MFRCCGPWSPSSPVTAGPCAAGKDGKPAEASPGQAELTAWVGLDSADVTWILAEPQLFPEFQRSLPLAMLKRYQHRVIVATLKGISET